VRVVGQPPSLVEVGDDKEFVNDTLRSRPGFTLPRGWVLTSSSLDGIERLEREEALTYPCVAKPVRGRGSFGVKVCHSRQDLSEHVVGLLKDSSRVMIEEFLSGEEATITVMPPSRSQGYYALPPVTRFNHFDGVAPWNGTVAVTANSRVVTSEEMEQDRAWRMVMRECEEVGKLLGATGMLRIDVRRFGGEEKDSSKFAIFDVNMKPVSFLFFFLVISQLLVP
jgi:carbamoylphosphate synthase large subunit